MGTGAGTGREQGRGRKWRPVDEHMIETETERGRSGNGDGDGGGDLYTNTGWERGRE